MQALVEVALEKLRKLVWNRRVTWCQSDQLLVSTWFRTSRRHFRRPLLTDLSLIRWSSNFCSLMIRTISISRPFQWVGKLALAKSKFFCMVSNFSWSFLYSASTKRCEYKLTRNSSWRLLYSEKILVNFQFQNMWERAYLYALVWMEQHLIGVYIQD